MNKEEIKTFLLYLTVGAVIILSANTFIQNEQLHKQNERLEKMQKQLDEFYNVVKTNQEILKTNKNLVGNLSEEHQ